MEKRNKQIRADELEIDNIPLDKDIEFSDEIKVDTKIVETLKTYGFKPDYISTCLHKNELNHCNAAYHLLQKD